MAIEASKLALLNSALRMVGSYHIDSTDESSSTYEIASRSYTQAVTELFADNSFNYNTKRVVLTGVSDSSFTEYGYKFTLPADFNVFLLVENANDFVATEYRFANGCLYSAETGLKLTYTYVPTLETTAVGLPKFLTRLLTLHMAQNMCIELSGSDERHELLANQYALALRRAKTLEGRQGPAQEYVTDALRMVGSHQKKVEGETDRIFESSTSYEIASRSYSQAISEVFGNNSFNFNTKRAALTGVTSTEFSDLQYEYTLPADYNTFLVIEKSNDFLATDYRFANDKLYSDEATLKLTYTFIPIFEAADFELPSFLRSLLTLHMAQNMSLEISGSEDRHQILYGEYLKALDKAKSVESRQGPAQEHLNDALRMVGNYQKQSEGDTTQVYDSSTTYEIASRAYSQSITEIFGNNSFSFNTKRVTLTGAASTEYSDLAYEHTLPGDYNTFLVVEKANDFLVTNYRFANGKLFSAEATLKLTYTFIPLFEASSFELPPFLKSLVTLHMAQSMALEISGSSERAQLLYGSYLEALAKAKHTEGKQGPAQEYVNDALRMVGSYQKQSEGDTNQTYDSTTTYEIASRSYSQAINEIFGNNSFSFNTKRASLTGVASAEFSDFGYEYTLPGDYNTFLVIEKDNDFLVTNYRFANGKLYSVETTLKLTYTFIPLFEASDFELPPFLRSLLTLHMAQNMALEISGSSERHQLLYAEYLLALGKAKTVEGRQGPSQEHLNDALRMIGSYQKQGEGDTGETRDSTTTYEVASRSFAQAITEVFGNNSFNFNTKRVSLTGTSSTEFSDFDYEYDLPSDYNTSSVIEKDNDFLVTNYRFANEKLYSDESTLNLTYTFIPLFEGSSFEVPPFLKSLVTLHMAQNMSLAISGSTERHALFYAEYLAALSKSIATEGSQGPAQEYITDALRMVGNYQKQGEGDTGEIHDSTTTYEIASRSYSQAITEIFGNNSFNFNTKRVSLTGTSSTEFSDFGFEYDLPSDYNTFLVVEKANDFLVTSYRFANEKLYSAEATLKLTYTFIPLFEGSSFKLPPFLKNLVTSHMAQNMALEISGSAERHQLLYAEYLRALAEVKTTEGRQGPAQEYITDALRMVGNYQKQGEGDTGELRDSTTTYEIASRSYSQAITEIFGNNSFNFNTKRVRINGYTNAEFTDHTYKFTLPADYNTFLTIETDAGLVATDYRFANGNLYYSGDYLRLTYTFIPLFEGANFELPPFLRSLVTLHMAQNMALEVSGSAERHQLLYAEYLRDLQKARALETRQGPSQKFLNDAIRMVGASESARQDGTDKIKDSGTTYEMARRAYSQAVTEIFGDNIFSYNTKLVTQTGSASTAFKGYAYQYTLPSDLNVLLKTESSDDFLVTDYRIDAGILYSSEPSLKIIYTYVPSLSQINSTLPAFLNRTLLLHMAQNLVIALAGPENPYANRRYETLAKQYTSALRRARVLEGRQGPAQTYINDENSQFINAHQRYGRV